VQLVEIFFFYIKIYFKWDENVSFYIELILWCDAFEIKQNIDHEIKMIFFHLIWLENNINY